MRSLPTWLTPLALKLIHLQARILRPLTMGVRGVVLDGENRVFLVRHSYVPGWHCPGGAVEPGETVKAALVRELREEGAIAVAGEPVFHGLFFNRAVSPRDHVAVYVVRDFTVAGQRRPDWEIVESGFFPIGALPAGTTGATRRRLAEILEGAPLAEQW